MEDRNRERIIQAAWELFDERGFKNVTISDLAERLGCSKSTIYRYFPSKEHIAEEMFTDLNNHFINYYNSLKESGIGPIERLKKIIEYYREHANQLNPLFIEDIYKYSPCLAEKLRGIHDKKVQSIEETIKEGQELGLIGNVDSHMVSVLLSYMVTKNLIKQNFISVHYGFSAAEISDFLLQMTLSGIKSSD